MNKQHLKEQGETLVGLGLELANMADMDLSEFDPCAVKALRRKLSALGEVMQVATAQSVVLTTEMQAIVQGQIEREGQPVQ